MATDHRGESSAANTPAVTPAITTEKSPDSITPIDFTPVNQGSKRRGKIPSSIQIVFGVIFAVIALVFWYLFTAKTLIVHTVPENAEVAVDGIRFRIAGNFLLRPGERQVEVSAPGYHNLSQTVMVGDAPQQTLTVELKKLPGHLQVTAVPEGAAVSLNGVAAGLAPALLESLEPKNYALEITAPRYFPHQETIDIEGLDKTQTIHIELKPAWGDLEITSEPAGATVTVGGEIRGVTPITTTLLSAGESVELKLPGHKRWQQILKVSPGDLLQIPTVQLQPADGLLQVRSQPVNANITVNGRYRGQAPIELELKPGQSHQLKFYRDGYRSVSRTVTLESGVEQTIDVRLVPEVGEMRILTQPAEADIYIDGTFKGKSGQTFSLPARNHRLEVRATGYASETKTISPKPGIEQVLQVKLLTLEESRWASTPREVTSHVGQTLRLFRPDQTFTMGASRREPGRRANEVIRDVRLEKPFYLSTHAVTNSQYKKFDRKHTSSHVAGVTLDTPTQPVIKVSWQKAAAFCNWLSERENLVLFYEEKNGELSAKAEPTNGYRLPTEAEWAWAARFDGGAMMKYPWGERFPPPPTPTGNYADASAGKILGKVMLNYRDGAAATASVGRYPPNSKGLFDMGSNVSEWVNDFYGVELGLSMKTAVDPLGPETGDYRVIRGASWRDSDITELRLSYRDYGLEGKDDIGFRVARYAN
ncbi:MAG: PEGA domain-containing protein [bacterium]